MTGFTQDLHYALRQLRKSPGFVCTAVLVLALGISASTAIFAFVDAALIKPLPYANPTQLVEATGSVPLIPRANLSYLDYLDWKSLNQVFSSVAVHNGGGYMLSTPNGVEPVAAARVSDGFFRTLGITPVLGRDFYAGEDSVGAPATVILSYNAWQKRFGGRRDVVGRTITLSDVAHTIIGVLPQGFQFAPRGRAEFWTSLQPNRPCELRRSCHNLVGIARLKDGVSVQAALANAQSVAQQLEKQYPDSNRSQGASVILLSAAIVGDVRPILLVLLGGAGLLFVIACVNVASLVLVRSESRKREIALRGALGATPKRLIRQFVTEGLVLVAAGGALGLVSAYGLMQILLRLMSKDMMFGMPFLNGLGFGLHALAFAGVMSLLAAILFSVIPVTRTQLTRLRDGLSEGGRGFAGTMWRRFGSNLVVVELAIAMVLLVGAGLLTKSLYRLLQVEVGFEPDHLATVDVVVPAIRYAKDEQKVALVRKVTSSISSLPGVKSVGLTSMLPVSHNGNTSWIRFVGKPYQGEHNEVNQRDISSDYFATLQAKLRQGRYFADSDDRSKPNVVVINQALAKQYFPGEDPIGKKIGDNDLTPESISEIVGVVEDVRESTLDTDTWPTIYHPFNQNTDNSFSLVIRTSQDESSVFTSAIGAIRQIDPEIGLMNEATMNQKISDSQTAYLHRSSAWLVGGFAAVALMLSVVGLYGIIAYSVSQRTREIGVRMALGAQRGSVLQLILKEAGWLTAAGLVLGIVCSLAAAALMSKLLFGVRSWDMPTLAAVALLLSAAALLASYIPARRASRVDPMVALRYE
jgi:macrolide transport system ATP-binding/permease protein